MRCSKKTTPTIGPRHRSIRRSKVPCDRLTGPWPHDVPGRNALTLAASAPMDRCRGHRPFWQFGWPMSAVGGRQGLSFDARSLYATSSSTRGPAVGKGVNRQTLCDSPGQRHFSSRACTSSIAAAGHRCCTFRRRRKPQCAFHGNLAGGHTAVDLVSAPANLPACSALRGSCGAAAGKSNPDAHDSPGTPFGGIQWGRIEGRTIPTTIRTAGRIAFFNDPF